MGWIESHEEIGEHFKTHKLALQLNCSVPTAVGYMHLLWHYTLKVSWQSGDLSQQPNFTISRACWFDGHPDALIKAFQNSGILDGMKVHDWDIYAKQLIYQRLYNSKRKDKKTVNVNTAVNTAVVKATTIPNLTQPNLTKIKSITFDFESLWIKYPNKDGKKQALKYFRSSVKTEKDMDDIHTALNNYLLSKRVKEGYIKNGSTWFNNWRDWIDVTHATGKSQAMLDMERMIEDDRKRGVSSIS
jgi:hypothetical protein